MVTQDIYPDLKTWRTAKGLKQRTAADFLRISRAHYSRLENRLTGSSRVVAWAIHEKTGVPVEILLQRIA